MCLSPAACHLDSGPLTLDLQAQSCLVPPLMQPSQEKAVGGKGPPRLHQGVLHLASSNQQYPVEDQNLVLNLRLCPSILHLLGSHCLFSWPIDNDICPSLWCPLNSPYVFDHNQASLEKGSFNMEALGNLLQRMSAGP